MKVLALASYPTEAAATRYRLEQFVAPLAEKGISVTVRPFLDSKLFAQLYRRGSWPRTAAGLAKSTLLRPAQLLEARRADVVLIQREAMMFGPPLVEWLTSRVLKRPMILDLDDATYVSYTSPTHGRLATALKWPGKTDYLIRQAELVICGNRAIADYVSRKGARAEIIPTVVDAEVFCPPGAPKASAVPVLGWIGTHSTFPFLESIFPVLQRLAESRSFRLKIVGAGKKNISIDGVEVENCEWQLQREVADFQSLDIGLYPIKIGGSAPPEWAAGKSGFKAIQYMSVGIPFVATPIGASAEIGEAGATHFNADSGEEWYDGLARLLDNLELRGRMGKAGRQHIVQHYSLSEQADKLARALYEAQSTGS